MLGVKLIICVKILNVQQMEYIRNHLDKDTSLLIFEYLINDENYTSFKYEDIVSLSNKITRWDLCLYWATKNNKLNIVKYSRPFINDKNVWHQCMYEVVREGHIEIFRYVLRACGNKIQCGAATHAGEGGHMHMLRVLDDNFDGLNPFIAEGAAKGGHLKIFSAYIAKSTDLVGYQWSTIIEDVVDNNHLDILMYIGENIVKAKGIYISTAVWNKCMLKATGGGYIDIVKYAGERGAYNWNECMKNAAYYQYFDILKYAESKGADDWKESLDYVTRMYNSPCETLSKIIEYLKYKSGVYKRRRIGESLFFELLFQNF